MTYQFEWLPLENGLPGEQFMLFLRSGISQSTQAPAGIQDGNPAGSLICLRCQILSNKCKNEAEEPTEQK